MLQRRKRYKNRTILGFKTLAGGVINMAQVGFFLSTTPNIVYKTVYCVYIFFFAKGIKWTQIGTFTVRVECWMPTQLGGFWYCESLLNVLGRIGLGYLVCKLYYVTLSRTWTGPNPYHPKTLLNFNCICVLIIRVYIYIHTHTHTHTHTNIYTYRVYTKEWCGFKS